MPNINAALGLAQLEQINDFLYKKRSLAKIFNKEINIKGVKVLMEPKNSKSNYWLNSLIIENFNTLNELLEKQMRMVLVPEWCGTSHQSKPYLNNCSKMELEVTDSYCRKILNIPSSSNIM